MSCSDSAVVFWTVCSSCGDGSTRAPSSRPVARKTPPSAGIDREEGFFRATVRLLGARVEPSPQVEQTVQKITALYEQFIKLSQSLNYDTMIAAARVDDPARLSDTIAANLQLPVDEKQDLLETVDPLERLNRIGDVREI